MQFASTDPTALWVPLAVPLVIWIERPPERAGDRKTIMDRHVEKRRKRWGEDGD